MCLEAQSLTGVQVIVQRESARVERAFAARRPVDVDPADTAAVGSWMQRELAAAGFTGKKVRLAVPRGNVSLKRLPVPRGLSPSEIPAALRLAAMQRQPGATGDLVFDCAAPPEGDALTAVMPQDRLDFIKSACKHAGLAVAGVHVRVEGVAELLRRETVSTGVLGLWVGRDAAGLVTVRDALPDIAREVEVSSEDALEAAAAVEASRTALLHSSSRIERVALYGGSNALADRVAESMDIPVDRASLESIDWRSGDQPPACIPLVGLALAADARRLALDFVSPWVPPDPRRARARQAAMLVAIAAIVAAAGWLLAQRELDGTRDAVDALRAERSELSSRVVAHFRADARLEHLRAWSAGDPDWFAHLGVLAEELPPRDRALLDALTGSVEADARYAPTRANSYYEGKWSTSREIRFDIEGAASRRQVSNALRERLIRSGIYDVATQGADVDGAFRYTLRTRLVRPERTPVGDSE